MKKVGNTRQIVQQIVGHHFGDAKSKKIVPLAGGLTNQVFCVHHEMGNMIVRIGDDPGKINSFMKEQWAIAAARELGVPAPEILQVGHEGASVPYMIARQAAGTDAAFHPSRMNIVRELGRYAAVINSITTTGFGATFEWSRNRLSYNETWREFLQNELKLDEALAIFDQSRMLKPEQLKNLQATLEMAGKNRTPCLNHGDLRLKNVLVDKKGAISCILDWEHCTSNLAPQWELSLALHDLSIDEKQTFLEGYGLSAKQISAIAPAMKAMAVINYAPSIHAAMKAKNTTKLDQYRVRLSGALDMFS